MKILVTGGAGFIGSHLVRQLLKNNFEVAVLDNLSSGTKKNLPAEINFAEMDIRDEKFSKFVEKEKFDAAVHLAGQTMVNKSVQYPKFDADVNVIGTINLLEAAKKFSVRRIVFASTAAVYGDVDEKILPIKESQPLNPMSFYALSKMTAENYLKLYSELFGLEFIALRFSNVYGEFQGDGGEGGVISIFSKLAAQKKQPTIFGDGLQTRDFIHAEDISKGICAALTTENKNFACNLSTQTEINLNELVKILSKAAGYEIFPTYQARRQGDIKRSSLSNEKSRKILNWKPKISLLEGLQRTYKYFCAES